MLPFLPWGFRRRPRALAFLRVAAVGLSLASMTALALEAPLEVAPMAVEAPTFVVGCVWAALIGDEKGKRRTWRWLASVPLAMINAGISCVIAATFLGSGVDGPILVRSVESFLLGATFGVLIWGPALLLTLLLFGLPIETARLQSKDGLAGEDRGDAFVGLACTFYGLTTLWVTRQPTLSGPPPHTWSVVACAILAALAGSTVAAVARARLVRRSWFLRDVERGLRAGYRIVETPEGRRRLTRVHVEGEAYRAAEVAESIFEIEDTSEPVARVPV
jgi:hypothetical protein